MRIAPYGELAAGGVRFARGFEIAVGEQHRRLGPVRLEAHTIRRENVGAIEKIGNAAKPLGLALGAIGRARAIEADELGVGPRIETGLDRELEGTLWRLRQHKLRRVDFEIGGLERLAVQSGGNEQKLVAVERQRLALPAGGIGTQRQGRDNARRVDLERYVELDVVDEIVRNPIVAETNGLSDRCAHGERPFEVSRAV